MTFKIPPELRPDNPQRPLDWRISLITHLEDHDPDRQFVWNEPWRKRVWQLLQLPRRTPICSEMLFQYPYAIDMATQLKPLPSCLLNHDGSRMIVTRGQDVNNLIESYALAGLSALEIARRIPCISVPVAEAYLALHFDVQDRLQDREFILKSVIRHDPTVGIPEQQPYLMWLECGYLAGPQALEAMTSIVKRDDLFSITPLRDFLTNRRGLADTVTEIARERILADYERTVEDLERLYRGLAPAPEVHEDLTNSAAA